MGFYRRDVPLEAIAPGALLMNAVISGNTVRIGSGSTIGTSGVAHLHDASLGERVELGAGSYEGCVLFDDVRVRGFAKIGRGRSWKRKCISGTMLD